MEKSQQGAIIYYFSLKGWATRKSATNSQIQFVRMYTHKPRFFSDLFASVQAIFPVSMKFDPEHGSQSWGHEWNISWKSSRAPVRA
jgi:hypothetical protein